jgi:acyl-CoA reductase-like NAD-dependent aldehyde dehydrogenase
MRTILKQAQNEANYIKTHFAEHEILLASQWLTGTYDLEIPLDEAEDSPERRVFTRYVPLGFVAGIVP